jgi:hypothetical protein
MFLKRTLISSIFREVLILRPEAAEIYIAYLKASESPELVDILLSVGRLEEASMVELALAFRKKQPDQKVKTLKRCLVSGLSDPALSVEAQFVRESINLLERQIPIDVSFVQS